MGKTKYQSIRLFENPFLESLSHVHPITPLILWVPIISYLLSHSIKNSPMPFWHYVILFFCGIFTWTLAEYLIHRFVFHYRASSSFGKRIIYLFHGNHHDDPNDPGRLVMPPVPGLLLFSLIYFPLSLIIYEKYFQPLMAFFLMGYLAYDYVHFATHHFKMKSKWGRYIKTYHLKHHYTQFDERYGVSNPLWDFIFKTQRPEKIHHQANESLLEN
jgi:sterol desaturase/sphingolipid hydroxylase (fatty acid hydroxylase superfamily)